MQALSWYINRLRQMSFGEVGYRLRQAAGEQAQLRGIGLANDVLPPDSHAELVHWLDGPFNVDADRYKRAADQVIAGRMSLFALEDAVLDYIPRWNMDIHSGIEAPLTFGKKLDYRDKQLVGDIKYLWEPNRHLQLVTLAQAYRLTKTAEYLHAIRDKLESWFVQCPYPKGPNWSSSLELGIRLINWALIWQLIGGASSKAFEGPEGLAFKNRWLTSVYQHTHFIAGHLSRFSSANNHFIGELTGLFVAGCTWPLWKDMQVWHTRSYEMLIREALLQTEVDGVNREKAIYYQHYVMDFLLIAALAGRVVKINFPRDYWARLEAMMDFIASVMDVAGNVPMIGDADGGYAVNLSQEPNFSLYRSLLATGAVLFDRFDFKVKSGWLDDKTKWLLGARAHAYDDIKENKLALPVRRAFSAGGYYILGSDFETKNEVRLIVDAGSLGYPSIAAHGHADALAFTLSVMGHEFLIDPGTYAYHTQPKWRDYFRGTAAHNTLRIDQVDQSVPGGNFMWIRRARARCEMWSTNNHTDLFCGSHDGYERLPDPVTHRREIRFDKETRHIQITDTVVCRRAHVVERIWHFSERCRVSARDNVIVVNNGGCCISMRHTDEQVTTIQCCGDLDRPAGWVSRGYGVKRPSTTLIWRTQVDGYAVLRTVIECPRQATSAKVEQGK